MFSFTVLPSESRASKPTTASASCTWVFDEGIEKPAPAIYALSVEQLGVAPERCLFLGDGGNRELTGARKAGMVAAWIRVDAEIREEGWFEDAAEWDGDTITTIAGVLDLL